ncbi:MAG TPA: hypothetical protein VF062_06370 [Candidatus Limnocylindrales bacterium]
MTRVQAVSEVSVAGPGGGSDAAGSAMMTPIAVTIDAVAAASHERSRRPGWIFMP